MTDFRFKDPERKCFIIRGWCFGCGKSEDPAREICFFEDPFWQTEIIEFEPYVLRSRNHKGEWTKSKRETIFERDGYKCLACGTTKNLTLDHIIPKAQDGDNAEDNLQTLCKECNGKKGNRIRNYRQIGVKK